MACETPNRSLHFQTGVGGGFAPHRQREDEAGVLLHQLAHEVGLLPDSSRTMATKALYRGNSRSVPCTIDRRYT